MIKVLFFMGITMATSMVYARFRAYRLERTIELRETQVEFDASDKDVRQLSYSTPAQFTDCGKTGAKFSVQLDPSILTSDTPATLTWDIVAPCDLNTGIAHIKLYNQADPTHALINVDRQASCDQVHSFLPEIKCPIKKNDELKGRYEVPSSIGPLMKGKYIFAMNITNENSQVFACGKVNFEIA